METFTYLKTAITDSYERDVMNGDAYSRSRWFSYAVGTIGASIVGTKGAGALTKSTTVTTRSVVQNSTQSQRLMNLLPDGPSSKFTPSKDIPFNVYNGPAIRSQLLSSMKAAIARMEQPKSPAVTMQERIAAVQSQASQKSAEVGKVIDRTLTNVTNTFSKTPEFSFASGVVKPMDRPSPKIEHPGKDLVSRIEDVGIGGKGGSKGKGNPLLPGEGKVGTYEELIDAGTRGDNITPHHMPSA